MPIQSTTLRTDWPSTETMRSPTRRPVRSAALSACTSVRTIAPLRYSAEIPGDSGPKTSLQIATEKQATKDAAAMYIHQGASGEDKAQPPCERKQTMDDYTNGIEPPRLRPCEIKLRAILQGFPTWRMTGNL